MLATASTATTTRAERPRVLTAVTTTSRAASAATLDTPARNTVTGRGDPAYAVGVHAWKGASDSLKAMPPEDEHDRQGEQRPLRGRGRGQRGAGAEDR